MTLAGDIAGAKPATKSQHEAWGLDGFAIGTTAGGGGDARRWQRDLERVSRADELGFHSVWLPEMHFTPGACASPLVGLHAFAARTKRLRLATTSLLLPIHEPVGLAREVAALDIASGGRTIISLGRGFRAPLFDAFGVDRTKKRDIFDASLEVMLDEWKERSPTVQRPHPPLAVAAFGPKGLLQAARHALPYLPSMIESLDSLSENYRVHGENLPEGLAREDLVVPALRTIHVARTDAEARRVLAALEAETRPRGAELPKAIARAAEGAIGERAIVGTVSEVVDMIGGYRERIGLDLLIAASYFRRVDEDELDASHERLALEVLPQLR